MDGGVLPDLYRNKGGLSNFGHLAFITAPGV
jgi:hypothetical protein